LLEVIIKSDLPNNLKFLRFYDSLPLGFTMYDPDKSYIVIDEIAFTEKGEKKIKDKISKVTIHELIHQLEPILSELQVIIVTYALSYDSLSEIMLYLHEHDSDLDSIVEIVYRMYNIIPIINLD